MKGSAPRALRLLCLALLVAPAVQQIPVPGSKGAIEGMATIIRGHIQWNNWTSWSTTISPFFWENFTYDFVHPFGKTHTLRDWYLGEHLHYNEAFPNFKSTNFLFLGEGDHLASLQSYHTVWWKGEFGGVPAPPDHPLIYIKDLDFYILKDKKIWYNWCLVDVIAILQQGGYEVIPPPPLPNGIDYLPPRAMDGIPSPDDNYVRPGDAEAARQVFHKMLEEDFVAQSTEARWWAPDLQWCGPAAVGMAKTPGEYTRHFLEPLHRAFPRPVFEMGSSDCEGNYCGALFYLTAAHTGPWLGEDPTGADVKMKFAMHARVDLSQGPEGLIADAWLQVDVPDAFMQMGVDLLARARQQSLAARAPAALLQGPARAAAPPPPPLQAGASVAALCGAVASVAALLWLAPPGRSPPARAEPLLA